MDFRDFRPAKERKTVQQHGPDDPMLETYPPLRSAFDNSSPSCPQLSLQKQKHLLPLLYLFQHLHKVQQQQITLDWSGAPAGPVVV